MSDALLLGLEKVLEEAGWDQVPRLYLIEGSEVEPTFRPFVEVVGHPCDVLQQMWHEGVRVPEATIGLALIVEGERHLRTAELEVRAPASYADLLKTAAEQHGGDLDAIQVAVETAWTQTCAEVSPLSMPENFRVHVRNSVAVLHTGWTLMVIRDRGGDPEVLDPVPPKRLAESRVPDFMWQFLTGKEPVD